MNPEKQQNLTPSEEASNPEKKELTGKKLVTAMSILAIALVVGGGIAFERYHQNHQVATEVPSNPNDQTPNNSVESNNSTPNANNSSNKTGTKKSSTKKNNSSKPEVYIDPGTGEKVVTVPGKTPENTQGHNITMLGFVHLINDCGMTMEQVKKLQSEFEDYSASQPTPFHELSITLSSIRTTVDSHTGNIELDFGITLDRSETENAKVEYFGIDNPKLTVYSSDNEQIYSSK